MHYICIFLMGVFCAFFRKLCENSTKNHRRLRAFYTKAFVFLHSVKRTRYAIVNL